MKFHFSESEQEHLARLSDLAEVDIPFNPVRNMRRALVEKMTGEGRATTWWARAMGAESLADALWVTLEGNTAVPCTDDPDDGWKLEWLFRASQGAELPDSPWTADDEIARILDEQPPSRLPYGYFVRKGFVRTDYPEVIRSIFQQKIRGVPFRVLAQYLASTPLSAGPSGKGWNKERVRTWMGNPVHAGFVPHYLEKTATGATNKRGLVALVPISSHVFTPPVTIFDWLEANPAMRERVRFPYGLREM